MATPTPKRFVHWDVDSPSSLDSVYLNTSSESSATVSTSSWEYVNAQLVAHGFAPAPGLCLDGISNEDSSRVVKCLLGLLSQRMDDMSRTENLTAKYRSLTYDLDRMRSLHRTETEKAANAEREMNLYKSRLAISHKSLQACENTQKQTASELQRTRTLLQGIRATHQSELKKKEKDIERVMEKWQKVSDSQHKLGHTQSGLRCANVAAIEGEQVGGRGSGFLDVALEQAEQARNHLHDENTLLQKIILKTVNELRSAMHTAQCMLPGNHATEEPSQIIMTALFTPSPPSAVSDKIDGIMDSLKQILSSLREMQVTSIPTPSLPGNSESEIMKLRSVIANLEEELALSRERATAHLTETQRMFDKLNAVHPLSAGVVGEMSVELLSAPLRDEEKERLEKMRVELDSDRQRFTEAAIVFGQERAALEAERVRFLEEKRSWEFAKMLADLPATPKSPSLRKSKSQPSPHKKSIHASPHKSPRKSPAKGVVVGKAGSGCKAHRVPRTSFTPPGGVISYETELIPPALPALKPFVPSSTSLLPTSFVLPPPSPRASLPTQPALPPARFDSIPEVNIAVDELDNLFPTLGDPAIDEKGKLTVPATPAPLPFPVAKPFAQRMIHAYSPARPSPLSRILMLASPTTPPRVSQGTSSLSPISEPAEGDSQDSLERVLGIPPAVVASSLRSTVIGHGDSETVPESPSQEEKDQVPKMLPSTRGGRVFVPDAKPKKVVESATRTKALGPLEKENRNSSKPKVFSKPAPADGTRKVSPVANNVVRSSKTTVKSSVSAKAAPSVRNGKVVAKPVSVGGGPRRVPINSVDAPPIKKG